MTMSAGIGGVPPPIGHHQGHAGLIAQGGVPPTSHPGSPPFSNSLAIRQEIQRFESVHPSIYAIYDLIEAIPDPLVQQQIRSHVVCIEDSFVNSQEWTLSRSVPELRLGILGSLQSGKSALVHRYLTGSYMQEESPEGGRFKKEVVVDGQSFLLLIRDEGGPPEAQFTHWVDAVIFVFSLENEPSIQTVYSYYAQMARYRNMSEIPLILVGTQDAISETSPRMIDDVRARKLAADLKQCSYYETCATYGLNVERVFQEACLQITQSTRFASTPSQVPLHAGPNCRPSTPSHSIRSSGGSYGNYYQVTPLAVPTPPLHSSTLSCGNPLPSTGQDALHASSHSSGGSAGSASQLLSLTPPNSTLCVSTGHQSPHPSPAPQQMLTGGHSHPGHPGMHPGMSMTLGGHLNHNSSTPFKEPGIPPTGGQNSHSHYPSAFDGGQGYPVNSKHHSLHRRTAGERVSDITRLLQESEDRMPSTPTPAFPLATSAPDSKDLPTPCSTPTQSRKNKRKSNLFTPNKKDSDKNKDKAAATAEEIGSGRAIPIKQGFLYKKSQKALSREWKKKYCTLSEGKLIYHASLHDYMDDLHGKSIPLTKTTVKIPGQPPRGAQSLNQTNSFSISHDMASLSLDIGGSKDGLSSSSSVNSHAQRNGAGDHANLDGFRSASMSSNYDDHGKVLDENGGFANSGTPITKAETPQVKKRTTRKKKDSASKKDGKGSGGGGGEDGDESDGYEFLIISFDNKTWNFEASSSEERREWVQAIEQTIHNALQGVESSKSKSRSNTLVDAATISSIRQVKGNQNCVDCGKPNPDWASLNLGALMCIECSGVHRNLGTHLSRVRSLDLDEWPSELSQVMTSIGNHLTNSVWEGGLTSRSNRSKPRPDSTREEKESWIRAKYENKEFLSAMPTADASTLGKQLIEAITRDNLSLIILLLAHANLNDVNATYSTIDRRTPLHFSAALGSSVVLQLLLWNGADVNKFDHESRSALYFARKAQAQECVRILQNNGCPDSGIESQPQGPAALMASVMMSSLNAHSGGQVSTAAPSTLTRHFLPGTQSQKGQNNDVFDKLPASVI